MDCLVGMIGSKQLKLYQSLLWSEFRKDRIYGMVKVISLLPLIHIGKIMVINLLCYHYNVNGLNPGELVHISDARSSRSM